MCLEEFLTGESSGHWDSAGEFGVGDSITSAKPLPRLRMGNDGRWVDEFVTHAVQVGATFFELTDCGECLDETIGLRLDYDAPRPQTSLVETSLQSFTRGEPYNDRLALALAKLRNSGTRIGEWRLGPAEAHLVVCCTDRCLRFDLLTGGELRVRSCFKSMDLFAQSATTQAAVLLLLLWSS